MKYSLRSLMIVVTLACVLFAGLGSVIGRIAYLKQRARFHSQQATELERQLFAENYSKTDPLTESADRTARRLAYHRSMHHEFTRAAERPWTGVDESAVTP